MDPFDGLDESFKRPAKVDLPRLDIFTRNILRDLDRTACAVEKDELDFAVMGVLDEMLDNL